MLAARDASRSRSAAVPTCFSLQVLGPGESGKEWWPLMQRIQAAFRGAMCGAPLSSQAPSSSSGMTGHASSPYPPIVDLAWAVYVACANSAVLLTRFWSKEAAAGRSVTLAAAEYTHRDANVMLYSKLRLGPKLQSSPVPVVPPHFRPLFVSSLLQGRQSRNHPCSLLLQSLWCKIYLSN
jgi:hypothetical protein